MKYMHLAELVVKLSKEARTREILEKVKDMKSVDEVVAYLKLLLQSSE